MWFIFLLLLSYSINVKSDNVECADCRWQFHCMTDDECEGPGNCEVPKDHRVVKIKRKEESSKDCDFFDKISIMRNHYYYGAISKEGAYHYDFDYGKKRNLWIEMEKEECFDITLPNVSSTPQVLNKDPTKNFLFNVLNQAVTLKVDKSTKTWHWLSLSVIPSEDSIYDFVVLWGRLFYYSYIAQSGGIIMAVEPHMLEFDLYLTSSNIRVEFMAYKTFYSHRMPYWLNRVLTYSNTSYNRFSVEAHGGASFREVAVLEDKRLTKEQRKICSELKVKGIVKMEKDSETSADKEFSYPYVNQTIQLKNSIIYYDLNRGCHTVEVKANEKQVEMSVSTEKEEVLTAERDEPRLFIVEFERNQSFLIEISRSNSERGKCVNSDRVDIFFRQGNHVNKHKEEIDSYLYINLLQPLTLKAHTHMLMSIPNECFKVTIKSYFNSFSLAALLIRLFTNLLIIAIVGGFTFVLVSKYLRQTQRRNVIEPAMEKQTGSTFQSLQLNLSS